MNLTNQQVEALVQTIAEKERGKHKSAYEKSNKEKRAKSYSKAKELMVIYNKIPPTLKTLMYSHPQLSLSAIISKLAGSEKQKSFDVAALRNKIQIASIDSVDMKELKNKLKINF